MPRAERRVFRIEIGVMAPGIRAQMLPRLVEGRAGAAAITQDGVDRLGEIRAPRQMKDILRHIRPDSRDEDRDAVDDRVFALAPRAEQDALQDIAALLPQDAAHPERLIGRARLPADGADRRDDLEMAKLHPRLRLFRGR